MAPNRILAANLLLIRELERLAERLGETPVMVLKGGALLLSGCRGFEDRPMEDLDLLVEPRCRREVVNALEAMGYQKFAGDPGQYRRDGLAFDLHDDLWYLDDEEHKAVWRRSRSVDGGEACLRLPSPQDLLIHVLAHAAVHHGAVEPKWAEDVAALAERHARELDLEDLRRELKRLGLLPAVLWFLRRAGLSLWTETRGQGHILRFVYLRDWRFRLRYLGRTLFPSADFIAGRYDARSRWGVLAWRVLRPLLLLGRLLEPPADRRRGP